ncbi:MAG: glycosyltransferase family 4 protein [Candidatus Bathyarchaeia archaeon]
MRVLLTSTDNPYITHLGGKHIHLLLLERGLREIGAEVITLYYNPKNLRELIKRSALLLLKDKYGYKSKLKWMIDYLRRHIPENAFDVIHAHDVLSLISTAENPQKKVLTLHGYFARENIEFIENEKTREELYPYFLQLEREGMKNADYVITVDQRLKEYVISEFNYPADKISVTHNAVDTDLFKPVSEDEQRKLKKTFGFSEDNIIILVARRLVEKNGVIYAVQALKHIKNEQIRMVIAGDGPEKDKIMREADEDNRIRFAGLIPHNKIAPYYKMADIILIPSITSHGIQEATSLAMLEGMACGKVAICSNIGGMREVISHMENGILIEEKAPKNIAEAIKELVENKELTTELGRQAREYVLKNHSYVVHAKKILEIYSNVLGERKNG